MEILTLHIASGYTDAPSELAWLMYQLAYQIREHGPSASGPLMDSGYKVGRYTLKRLEDSLPDPEEVEGSDS